MSKSKMLILPAIAALGLTALTGCNKKVSYSKMEADDYVNIEGDIKMVNMNVRRLSSGTDSNNHPYQILSYETVPANPYYGNITVSMTSNGTNKITNEINLTNKTLKITCLDAFDSVITVTLTAEVSNSYAEIAVHYKQKFLSLTGNSVTFDFRALSNSGIDVNRSYTFLNCLGTNIQTASFYTESLSATYTDTFDTSGSYVSAVTGSKTSFSANSNSEIYLTNLIEAQSDYRRQLMEHLRNASYGFPSMNLNDVSTYGAGFYQVLHNVITTYYNASTKYKLVDILDDESNGCFNFSFNLSNLLINVTYPHESSVVKTMNLGNGTVLNVIMPPLAQWNLSETAVYSISPESSSIYF